MKSINKNLLGNALANIYGQIVTVGIQLLSLPVFLYFWSVEEYGRWVILTAIPYYMSMADLGIVGAASNRMALHSASGNYKRVNQIFSSMLVLLLRAIAMIFIVGVVILIVLKFSETVSDNSLLVIFVLMLVSAGNIFPYLCEAVCRSANKNALGVYLTNSARIIEWIGGIFGVVIGQDYQTTALGMLLGRLVANFGVYIATVNKCPNIKWATKFATNTEIRSLYRPSLAFVAFPVGNILSIQGLNFFIGLIFGPTSAAIFATHRTLSRILVQIVTVISHSTWPEFSKLYALGLNRELLSLYKKSMLFGLVFSIFAGVSIHCFGSVLIGFWSRGELPVDTILLDALVLSTVTTALWQPGRVLLMAIGKHIELSQFYLFGNTALIGFCYIFSFGFGFYSAAIAILIAEFYFIFITRKLVGRVFYRNMQP